MKPYIDGDETFYVKAKLGSTIFLPCHGHGSPTPEKKWTKNKATTEVSRGAQTIDGLIIPNAQISDNGVYHCKIESGLGMAEKLVTVDIYGTWKTTENGNSARGLSKNYKPRRIVAPVLS